MKKITLALFIAAILATSLWTASAQQQPAAAPQKTHQQLSPEEVIKRFTAKESELLEVWKEYSYLQESKIQRLGQAKTVSGEFYQVSEFVFNDAGQRQQKIIKAPISDLEQSGVLTYEDKNALTNLQPFALTTKDLPLYNVSYVGKEKVDDLNTYVFDVTPKVMSNERELKRLKDQKVEGKFFQGRIWVDDEDMQVVKTAGKVVPEFKQRFPKFETYRENIDGRYWFPTYTYGDDTLYFDGGEPLHIRMVIKYKNYRRFQSDIKFLDAEEVKPDQPKTDDKAKAEAEAKPGDVKKDAPKAKPTPTPRPRP
jgi:outer membrane lipoprotein-sorting protein